MGSALGPNILELDISFGMLLAGFLFDIGAQAVALGAQQATDHRFTDSVAALAQFAPNIDQATVEPFGLAHRVTRRMRRDDLQHHS
jgi:hypothetical protein